jgi:glutamyl-tRNA synthetase
LTAAVARRLGAFKFAVLAIRRETPVRALSERLGWKAGDLFMALRVAVTMRRVSTPLFETMEVLGREECLARLDAAMARLPGRT